MSSGPAIERLENPANHIDTQWPDSIDSTCAENNDLVSHRQQPQAADFKYSGRAKETVVAASIADRKDLWLLNAAGATQWICFCTHENKAVSARFHSGTMIGAKHVAL